MLVVTTVHTPLDARIHHRQIRALRAANLRVTYVAPWRDYGIDPSGAAAGVVPVDVPRSVGRRRLRSMRVARAVVSRLSASHDVVIIHDPELLIATAGLGRAVPIIWDVHEDTAAAVIDKPWIPTVLRPATRSVIGAMERIVERRRSLILAERAYQGRFRRPHYFVPNVPPLPDGLPPPPGTDRVVFVGRVARGRGADELMDVAHRVADRLTVEVIGPADADVRPRLQQLHDRGVLVWRGFLPNDLSLERMAGALAGLSLVHEEPNHAVSLQTKVLEYASRRLPVVTTDLPVTGPFVRKHGFGITVPQGGVDEVVEALDMLIADPGLREAMGDAGYRLVRDDLNWERYGRGFVDFVAAIATGGTRPRPVPSPAW